MIPKTKMTHGWMSYEITMSTMYNYVNDSNSTVTYWNKTFLAVQTALKKMVLKGLSEYCRSMSID